MFWAGTTFLGWWDGWALYSWKLTKRLNELVQNQVFWLSVATCPVLEIRFSSLLWGKDHRLAVFVFCFWGFFLVLFLLKAKIRTRNLCLKVFFLRSVPMFMFEGEVLHLWRAKVEALTSVLILIWAVPSPLHNAFIKRKEHKMSPKRQPSPSPLMLK